jgi:uncharacterized Zn finger protein
MKPIEIDALKKALASHWSPAGEKKIQRYVGKFFERTRIGKKIVAKVEGNHGIYTVSIDVKGTGVDPACSCYIGGDGSCHHCHALALTFVSDPESFRATTPKKRKEVETLADLRAYLKGITLDALLRDLKTQGISQKALAESMGMNPQHLSSIKSCELRHHYYNELGATKVACLWVLEHIKKGGD